MTYTETWEVVNLAVRPEFFDQSNCISQVTWKLLLSADGVTWEKQGQIRLGYPGENFTAFEQLTEAQVLSWVHQSLGAERLQELRAEGSNWLARQRGYTTTLITQMPWHQQQG